MHDLFAALNTWMAGSSGMWALFGAFIWGICSVVLCPCHLASLPIIMGFVDNQGKRCTPQRAFLASALFAVGILMMIAVLGAVVLVLRGRIGPPGPAFNYVVVILIFYIGLKLLDLIPPLPENRLLRRLRQRSNAVAYGMGFFYGIALFPCTFAFLAPLLSMVYADESNPLWGGLLILCFGLGEVIPIVLAGTFVGYLQRFNDWSVRSRGAMILKGVCGVLIILLGFWMLYEI